MAQTVPSSRASQPSHSQDSAPGRFPAWARQLSLAGIVLVLGYAGGLLHGWQLGKEPQQRLAETIRVQSVEGTRARQELLQLQASNAELSETVGLFEAYRGLQQGLNALDARNFGTAESFVRASGDRLQALATKMPRLLPVAERVAQLRLEVAADLGDQRETLAELVGNVGALLSEPPLARRHAPVERAP